MNKMAEFVLMCLHGVTNTHLLHLKSRRLSEHQALGEFYPALEELVDSLAESMQGKYMSLMEYPDTYIAPQDTGLEELEALSEYVQFSRGQLPQDSEIQNQLDEIQSLINSTIYKLNFLR